MDLKEHLIQMKDKKKALGLLKQKQFDDSITYDDIARQTGYEKRQLMRPSLCFLIRLKTIHIF